MCMKPNPRLGGYGTRHDRVMGGDAPANLIILVLSSCGDHYRSIERTNTRLLDSITDLIISPPISIREIVFKLNSTPSAHV